LGSREEEGFEPRKRDCRRDTKGRSSGRADGRNVEREKMLVGLMASVGDDLRLRDKRKKGALVKEERLHFEKEEGSVRGTCVPSLGAGTRGTRWGRKGKTTLKSKDGGGPTFSRNWPGRPIVSAWSKKNKTVEK